MSNTNRRKCLVIAGMPGSGKSTLMTRFLARDKFESKQAYKLVPAHYSPKQDLLILGVYEPGAKFPGSDCMSMAVQPMAIEFLNSTTSNVIVEGDRLSTVSFFEAVLENDDIDFEVIYIETSSEILKKRYEERGSNQDEKFLKGRETKYRNILKHVSIEPFTVKFLNNDLKDQEIIFEYLVERFTWDPHTPKVVASSLSDLM